MAALSYQHLGLLSLEGPVALSPTAAECDQHCLHVQVVQFNLVFELT